jgi:hypothetical protein
MNLPLPLRLAGLRTRPWARRVVFVLVLLLLVAGGSLLPVRYAAVGRSSAIVMARQPVLKTMLTGVQAVNYAKLKMASKRSDHPARRAFEQVLQRPGVRLDLMIVSQVAVYRPQARGWFERSREGVLSFFGRGAVHAQDYSEGTIDIWITPFESDSYYGTTEYNEYMEDSDSGSWHITDLQLIIDDTGDPNNTFDQSTGWSDQVALNCGLTLEHARNRAIDFFTPVVAAQSYNGIHC